MTYKVVKGPPRVYPYEIHLRRTLHLNFFEEETANYQGCAVCTCLEQKVFHGAEKPNCSMSIITDIYINYVPFLHN